MSISEKEWTSIELRLMNHSEKVLELDGGNSPALEFVRSEIVRLNEKLVAIEAAENVADRLKPEF